MTAELVVRFVLIVLVFVSVTWMVLVSTTVTFSVTVVSLAFVTCSKCNVLVLGVDTTTVTVRCGVKLGESVGMRAREMLEIVIVE